MSGAELFVIFLGGVGGYCIVLTLMSRGKGKGEGKSQGEGGPQAGGAVDDTHHAGAEGTEPAACDRVLGIDAQAGPEQVHAAYARLIARYAPEQLALLDAPARAQAEQEARWIGEAYREAMRRRGVRA